ncbi:carbohydrate sulfotransferase 6-like [Babylonia areolata]|uniref:carbohydrate sulfotransferase 6-like n=1 Tax=Babylonia areolata TaxID=304850 RepID=UPI003FD3B995
MMPRVLIVFVFFVFKFFTLLLYIFSSSDSPHNLLESFSSSSSSRYDVIVDDNTLTTDGLQEGLRKLTEPTANTSAEVKLILLTYMRSGSSFTGDLFNHHPDVFYVYEPLYPVKWFFSRGEPATFLSREPVSPRDVPTHVLQNHVISSYLNCSLHALYLRALTYFGLTFGQKTRSFHRCLDARPGLAPPVHSTILGCLPLLQSSCATSRAVVLKVVRFTMDLVDGFLRNDPKVKVIHLLRDPRATLRSQRAKGMFRKEDIPAVSSRFCRNVLTDARRADRLAAEFPGRVTLARYEDLTDEPIRMSETLFEFVGLRTRDDGLLHEYIWNLTSAGLPDNSLSFTQRRNSKETAEVWRRRLDLESSRVIDDNCGAVYRRLGYLPLLTESDLKNVSVPSYVPFKDFFPPNSGLGNG